MMPRNAAKPDAGFTLIEVLVSLAILGVSMFVLLQTHYNAMSTFADVRDAAELDFLTAEALAAAEVEVLTGETRGEGEFPGTETKLTYTFEATDVDTANLPGLKRVLVTVNRPDKEPHVFEMMVFDGTQEVLQ